MNRHKHKYIACLFLFVAFSSCKNEPATQSLLPGGDFPAYLNHSDTARYVGMNTCKLCHQAVYNTFIHTGMGKSFDVAARSKSSAGFSAGPTIYDKLADLHYKAFWQEDSLYIKEYRVEQGDTIHSRTEQVNYIIGSGQHTNSHLQSINGYMNQMPMTYYTQKKRWDLPPGFENGVNTRFSRKIGLECMSCHNGYPEFVKGSENKYKSVPGGIDCERCHGPGSIHVALRSNGSRVDTSTQVDYSIVNPAKLSIDAQFDVCQRCHLQGNAVLKEGRSFYDFKPGQKLSDYISVFLPRYKNADDEFIMASHADRLKQSPCFIKSYEKAGKKNGLKPHQGAMTCVTCHNPHVSVKETNGAVFNRACLQCHGSAESRAAGAIPKKLLASHRQISRLKMQDCAGCHMPLSGSMDIPHVTVHDHYIRKPVTRVEKEKIKSFVGLFSVNEKKPDALTRARAYINQYDKFKAEPSYLDSALGLLSDIRDLQKNYKALIHLYFIKSDFNMILSVVDEMGEEKCFHKLLTNPSYENEDAWCAYRIAEASHQARKDHALKWFRKAVELAPYHLDFRNKLGTVLAGLGDLAGGARQFEFIMKENPRFVAAYANLGYIKLVQGFPNEARRIYAAGQKLDPDNESLLLNLAGYYAFLKDKPTAIRYLQKVLKKNPGNYRAKKALDQMKS